MGQMLSEDLLYPGLIQFLPAKIAYIGSLARDLDHRRVSYETNHFDGVLQFVSLQAATGGKHYPITAADDQLIHQLWRSRRFIQVKESSK